MDQTLISAEAKEDLDQLKYIERINTFKSKFPNEKVEYDMDGYYTVVTRPYLQEFLDYLFENFNVVIWTAATKDYALYIIEHIIIGGNKDRKIDFIFFSYHCDWSRKMNKYTKKLCMMWDKYKIPGYTSKNTVIIDDYKEDVHKCQPNNCIIAPPFEFMKDKHENDTFLKDLIKELDNMKLRIEKGESDLTTPINIKLSN